MTEPSPFRLIIHKPEADESFLLPIGLTTLGRDSGRELVLMHPMVSRLHAQIQCTLTSCQITDLESANGTTVNDQVLSPHTPHSLKSQDQIHIGPFELVLEVVPQKAEVALEMEEKRAKRKPADINAPSPEKDIAIKPFTGPPETPPVDGHPG